MTTKIHTNLGNESNQLMTDTLVRTTMTSPLGELVIVASAHGLRAVLWPADGERDKARVKLGETAAGSNPITDQTKAELAEYFAGDRMSFSIPLDLVGTELQTETWRSLAMIGYGETSTYGQQAVALGRPTAVRAVAGANGKNPVSIVLPCHRVIGADGALTGFAGGLEVKSWLLEHEQRNRADDAR